MPGSKMANGAPRAPHAARGRAFLAPLAGLAALLCASCAGAEAPSADPGGRVIGLSATPIPLTEADPEETRVGALLYRGGLELKSRDGAFGGFSGLWIAPDGGRLRAVGDMGTWLEAVPVRDGAGRLADLEGARMGALRDLSGAALRGKEGDAESLTPAGEDGAGYLVGFERDHRIWRYPALDATPEAGAVTLPGLDEAQSNGGLEAVAAAEGGHVAFLERPVSGENHHRGWFWTEGAARARPLKLAHDDHWAVTDAAALPGGGLLILERRFSPLAGPGMRLRRLAPGALAEAAETGKVLTGDVLADLPASYEIDNMEGLAVRTGPAGETLLYVLSDDNFNAFQRTLLLSFELAPDG